MGSDLCTTNSIGSQKRFIANVNIRKVSNGYIVDPGIYDSQKVSNTLSEALELVRKELE